jgi:hypothetical protein
MNDIAQQVKGIIRDEVGEFIGQVTVRKNCELIGTSEESLSYTQLPELAVKIEKFVAFYCGKDSGSAVSTRIMALQKEGSLV